MKELGCPSEDLCSLFYLLEIEILGREEDLENGCQTEFVVCKALPFKSLLPRWDRWDRVHLVDPEKLPFYS